MKYTQRVLLFGLLGMGAVLFLGRCGDDNGGQGGGQGAAKPSLGANEAFQTHGSTDDGDDGNGTATRYPPTRTSSDNLTTATSTPTTYRDIAVDLHAEPGANPTRIATSFGNTKATSTFTVTAPTTCRLFVTSEATVSLDSGLADYLVVARLRSAPATPGQTGPPVARSDTQARCEFKQSNSNPTMLDVSCTKRSGQTNRTIPSGGMNSLPDTSRTFTLSPGTYTLEFEITGNAKADTRADLNATAQVDLR